MEPNTPRFKLNHEDTLPRVPTDLTLNRPAQRDLSSWQEARLPVLSADGPAELEGETFAQMYEYQLRRFAIIHLDTPSETDFNFRFVPQTLLEHILNENAVLNIVTDLVREQRLANNSNQSTHEG